MTISSIFIKLFLAEGHKKEKGLSHFRPYPDIIVLRGACNLICLRLSAGRGNTKILLHLIPYPNDSVKNGDWSQDIVSYLVPDQVIVLELVPAKP